MNLAPLTTIAAKTVPYTQQYLTFVNHGFQFMVHSNQPFKGNLSEIQQVVIILHGAGRAGEENLKTADALLRKSGADSKHVLILAPQYLTETEASEARASSLPYWSSAGWKVGEKSLSSTPTISSFTVMDDLLDLLAQRPRFPALRRIVLAGHSAGGQYVQRYAALNQMDELLRKRGIELRYFVANPSSYLYFTPDRPSGKSFRPFSAALCPHFNTYRYGPEKLIAYASGTPTNTLLNRYRSRKVMVAAGTEDTNPNDAQLDNNCQAQAQGEHRLKRAHNYFQYMKFLSGGGQPAHAFYEVSGVGHSLSGMLGSTCAMQFVFSASAISKASCHPMR